MLLKNRFVVSKKTLVIASVSVAVIIACLAFVVVLAQQNKANNTSNKSSEQPQFSTLLPKGKSITSLGGWSRISPPSSEPVFAYNDTIAGISVNVSQQPLPKSFESNVDTQVAELAKQYSATNQISAGDTKVYIGTSSKGPQSLIFVKNNLLILIKSQQKIDNKDWSKYIESLS